MNRLGAILGACISFAVGAALAGWVLGWPWLPVAGSGLAVAGIVAAVIVGSALPGAQLFAPVVVRGETGGAAVALTFDDGPHPASTPAILATLEQAGARATFFVLVDRAQAHPHLVQAMARRHQVELHGLSHHAWLTVWPIRRSTAELQRAVGALTELIGRAPTCYRPPFGAVSPRLFAAVRAAGLRPVWCSVRTLDGVGLDPAEVRRRCARAGAGDIVLLHEGVRGAAEALPDVLDDLARRGLRAVTVDDLLGAA